MPYTTSVISGVDADAELWTPGRNASYFHWTADVVTVTAYAYSHDWANQSALEGDAPYRERAALSAGQRGQPRRVPAEELLPDTRQQIQEPAAQPLLSSGRYGECGGCDRLFEALELGPVEYSVSEWDEGDLIDVEAGRNIRYI